VIVPVLSDDGPAEEYESFRLVLDEPEGGAGLGTYQSNIGIQPDGAPAGQFSLDYYEPWVSEYGSTQLWLYRNYYSEGEVCVTLEVESGTAAAGRDFDAESSIHCWGDGNSDAKLIEIRILDDTQQERDEQFSLVLTNPTAGAVIGPRGAATLTIADNDTQPPRTGGGGSTGFLALLLLGLAEFARMARGLFRARE
jgi:hypothetical protein